MKIIKLCYEEEEEEEFYRTEEMAWPSYIVFKSSGNMILQPIYEAIGKKEKQREDS